jgi:hypothetical protein
VSAPNLHVTSGRLNVLRRHHGDDAPVVAEARQAHQAERIAAHAAAIVAAWPDLDDDQTARVVSILRGVVPPGS